jgi:hypothetical protein
VNRDVENLTIEEIRELPLSRFWKTVGTVRTGVVVGFIVAVAAATGYLVGTDSYGNQAALAERYQATTAVIVTEPSIANGNGYQTSPVWYATVETDNGLSTETAVDDQAQIGDTVETWIDTETGALWRASSASGTPINGAPLTDTICSMVLALLGVMIALYVLFRMCDRRLEWALEEQREAQRVAYDTSHYVH